MVTDKQNSNWIHYSGLIRVPAIPAICQFTSGDILVIGGWLWLLFYL